MAGDAGASRDRLQGADLAIQGSRVQSKVSDNPALNRFRDFRGRVATISHATKSDVFLPIKM